MYFDEKTQKTLRDLRKTLTDAGIRPVLDEIGDRPHISLAVFSQVDVDELAEELEKFAAETKAMPITLSAVGGFATADAVLFLTPAITQDLMDVHWDFHQMLGELKMYPHAYYQPDRWVPHSTVAQNVQEEMVGKGFDVLRKSFKPISGKLVEMGLVRFRPVESLGVYQLGARNSRGGAEARARENGRTAQVAACWAASWRRLLRLLTLVISIDSS
jgi:hypothetical protein